MANYRQLMQDVVDASNEERIALGKTALNDTIGILINNGISQDDTTQFIIGLISVFVSADRECSQQEYDLINAITGINFTEEAFYELTNGGANPEIVDALDEVIDSLSPHEKAPICLFGLTILASDEELTPEEQRLFTRLSD